MEKNSFRSFLYSEKKVIYYNLKLKPQARNLRNCMTDAERHLWSKIRMKQLRGAQFYRQKIIGNYIVDFYCSKAKIVIELDGEHHRADDVRGHDAGRDDYLNSLGLRVMRFSNREIYDDLAGVLRRIGEALQFRLPPPKKRGSPPFLKGDLGGLQRSQTQEFTWKHR